MGKRLIFGLLIIFLPVIVFAQASGGQVRRPVKKPQTTNTAPAPKKPSSKSQMMSESKKKKIIQNLINNMVYVEGGTFIMGHDTHYAHKETLNSFSIGKYEITQEEWKAVMGNNPSWFRGQKFPVENVSWNDCIDFIKKLNVMTGKQFRLPTEAEWEFAARGGNRTKNYKYSGADDVRKVAWCDENSARKTHTVGTKAANELGLYDMSGNVFEWCSDFAYNVDSDNHYMTRGGDYDCLLSNNESSPDHKHPQPGSRRAKWLGFRIACDNERIIK